MQLPPEQRAEARLLQELMCELAAARELGNLLDHLPHLDVHLCLRLLRCRHVPRRAALRAAVAVADAAFPRLSLAPGGGLVLFLAVVELADALEVDVGRARRQQRLLLARPHRRHLGEQLEAADGPLGRRVRTGRVRGRVVARVGEVDAAVLLEEGLDHAD